MRRLDWAALVVVVLSVLAVAATSIVVGQNVSQSADTSAQAITQALEAKSSASQAKESSSIGREIAEAVRGERNQSILRGCQEQNARHTNSVAYLTRLAHTEILAAKPGKKRRRVRKEALRGLSEFKLLFDALAPLQDCHTLVSKSDH